MPTPAHLKAEILRLVREYSSILHGANKPAADASRKPWKPGDVIPYAGRVFDESEVAAAVATTLDFWLTLGEQGDLFESELARAIGVKRSLLVNSGSSANLLAFAALTSHKLPPDRRIRRDDEVITVAAGFPTTVAPIIQLGARPVFVDSDPSTGNIKAERLEAAYIRGRTKAVVLAHALGNPFDIGAVLEFCRRHDLWLIEDNCDALGACYAMPESRARTLGLDYLLRKAEAGNHPLVRFIHLEPNGSRTLLAPTGTWGDLSTQSFYPPHHLTMGEGGAVNVVGPLILKTCVESFRDWGRDCWCPSGKDNTCGKRYAWQLGELPTNYDHKYIYSHLGFNLKPLDIQAAIGREQLKKLPSFIAARNQNWDTLRSGLDDLQEVFEFSLPTHAVGWIPAGDRHSKDGLFESFAWDSSGFQSVASWFGFMMRVRVTAPFKHSDLARYLDSRGIGNRMFFGGNLLRQPVFVQLRSDYPEAFRVAGALDGADSIMNTALFLGTYPGLTPEMLAYEIEVIRDYVATHTKS